MLPEKNKILQWLVESKITNDGKFYSWVNPNKQGYVYNEITGYGIKLLSILYARNKNQKFINLALNGAGYIVSQLKNGGISRDDIIYVFDTAICLSGVLHVRNLLDGNDQSKFDLPIGQMANFIKNSLSQKIPSYKNSKVLNDNKKWSLSYGSHLIKCTIALHEYSVCFDDLEVTNIIKSVCDELVECCFKIDCFVTNKKNISTYTHSHCYALEGLLFLKNYCLVNTFDAVISAGADWLAKQQQNDGSILSWYNNQNEVGNKNGDEISQAVRIWLAVDKSKYSTNIQNALGLLSKLQSSEGGLYYSINSKDINSWVSMFAWQALDWYENGVRLEEIL